MTSTVLYNKMNSCDLFVMLDFLSIADISALPCSEMKADHIVDVSGCITGNKPHINSSGSACFPEWVCEPSKVDAGPDGLAIQEAKFKNRLIAYVIPNPGKGAELTEKAIVYIDGSKILVMILLKPAWTKGKASFVTFSANLCNVTFALMLHPILCAPCRPCFVCTISASASSTPCNTYKHHYSSFVEEYMGVEATACSSCVALE